MDLDWLVFHTLVVGQLGNVEIWPETSPCPVGLVIFVDPYLTGHCDRVTRLI